MTRHTFFSFHYERDIFRCNVVRKSWVTQDRIAAGFWDNSLWEEVEQKGKDAISKMILNGLSNTSVTVVLIGAETANRDWINYEIIESYKRGNGMLGVYIHNIKSINGFTDTKGKNPFSYLFLENNSSKTYLSDIYPTYDYEADSGYDHLGEWIDSAAKKAGK